VHIIFIEHVLLLSKVIVIYFIIKLNDEKKIFLLQCICINYYFPDISSVILDFISLFF